MHSLPQSIPGDVWLRVLWDESPVPYAVVDRSGYFSAANTEFCELVGYTEGQLRHRTWQSITDPQDLTDDQAEVDRIIAGTSTDSYRMVKRYITAHGTIVEVTLSVQPVYDAQSRLECFMASAIPLYCGKGAKAEQTTNNTGGPSVVVRPTVTWRDIVRDNPGQSALVVMALGAALGGDNLVKLVGLLKPIFGH